MRIIQYLSRKGLIADQSILRIRHTLARTSVHNRPKTIRSGVLTETDPDSRGVTQ